MKTKSTSSKAATKQKSLQMADRDNLNDDVPKRIWKNINHIIRRETNLIMTPGLHVESQKDEKNGAD